MSVPKKMQEFAAFYGCEIVEKSAMYDGFQADWLYATGNDKEEIVCRTGDAAHIDLNEMKTLLQRVSGRTLAQFWTGR